MSLLCIFVVTASAIHLGIPLIQFLPAASLYKNNEQSNDLETNADSQTTLSSLTFYSF